ncbi:endonuclease 8-like 1 isoform X2 [Homarus americanus]|uniref:endonuclease 8-like 1 isoform X2 n=1 Tax=Homarus americanus TaxID=6706 RepID=UPI001C44AF69|nr:endonuclease 8-like 1 isoform X2 [Homarus americanus]
MYHRKGLGHSCWRYLSTVLSAVWEAFVRFFTLNEDTPMVLSFVDYRRFGRWEVKDTWGLDRGPDPMWEYQSFRENVMTHLNLAAFNKPICEAMLNQKYFNGIGNYLRAEILYRCSIQPFDEAREVLSEIKPISRWYETQLKQKPSEHCKVMPDILDLCHILPKEVIHLSGGGKGYNVDPDAAEDEYKEFRAWLQCYYQDGMKNLVDHNGRTMWFSGEPGRLTPKEVTSRAKVERKKLKRNKQDKVMTEEQNFKVQKIEKRDKEIKGDGQEGKKHVCTKSGGRRRRQLDKIVKEEPDSVCGPRPEIQNKRNITIYQSPRSSVTTDNIKKRGAKVTDKTLVRTTRTPRTPKTYAVPVRRSSRRVISQ